MLFRLEIFPVVEKPLNKSCAPDVLRLSVIFHFVPRAAKEMALVLKSWVGKDYFNKQLIPAETLPQKLVKDLTKQVAYVDKTALAENPVAPLQRPQVRILVVRIMEF